MTPLRPIRYRHFVLFFLVGCLPQPNTTPLQDHVAIAPPTRRSLARPAAIHTGSVLFRQATIWTATGKILKNHDLRVENGRIAAIGVNLASEGARIIEAKGLHLTPGMIDPHSHIGVYPVPGLRATADGNEIAGPVSPEVQAADAFWPQDAAISRALAAGVTTAQILPGSANLIGGQAVTIRMLPGRSVHELKFPGAPTAVKMACGENPKRIYGNKGGPFSRMGNVGRLRTIFQKAKEYRRKQVRYETSLTHWRGDKQRKAEKKPVRPDRNIQLEVLVDVLEGKKPVHWHCYRADDMVAMLNIADEFGFRIKAFHHAVEAYKIRDLLRLHQTAVVTWVNWWGFKAEATDAIPESAALLSEAGVLVSLHSDSPRVIQRYNHEGALAYYRGKDIGVDLAVDEGIKVVTINAARILGIDAEVGSLEKGKRADLLLWDGTPMDVYARVNKVFIDGIETYDRKKGRRPTDFELATVTPDNRRSTPNPRDAPTPPATVAKAAAVSSEKATLAFVGATIYPGDGPAIKEATLLVHNDRIVGLGKDLTIPPGTKRIDAKGLVLTPGLIASETALGMVEISMEATTNDKGPKDLALRPALNAAHSVNRSSWTIPVTRVEGFTTALVRPYGGIVSGQWAAFDLHQQSPDPSPIISPLAISAHFGQHGARAAQGSRALAQMRLEELFADARWLMSARNQKSDRKLSASRLQLRAIWPILKREIPLVLTANRAGDISRALAFAKRQQIRLVISGAAEGWKLAGPLAKAGIPVLISVDQNLPSSFDTLESRHDNAALLHQHGVRVIFHANGESHNARSLRPLAGIAIAWGLSKQAALAALTHHPATTFGLKDIGRLAPGMRANIVLWSGDPFSLKTRVKQLIIGGKVVSLESRQTELRKRYRRLPSGAN